MSLLSLLSFKRELYRPQYWLSILAVCLLFYAAFYAVLPALADEAPLPEWRKYISIALFSIGMVFWMSTVASRYYMMQWGRFRGALAVLVPFVNFFVTIALGFVSATLPGKEEKPIPMYLQVIIFIVSTILFIYLFVTADAFQDARTFIKQVFSAIIGLIILGYLVKFLSSVSDESDSSVEKEKPNKAGGLFSSSKSEPPAQSPQNHPKKEVGVYIINEGGYLDQKIRVYSDGQTFTAESNRKNIEADSFGAIEPLIYKTFKDDKYFRMIDSRQH